MAPTLLTGDMVFTEKKFDEPTRGDIFVYHHPTQDIPYIFRIIGMPNETIQYKNGRLFINNKVVERKYLNAEHLANELDQPFNVYEEKSPDGVTTIILETSDNGPLDNTQTYYVPENHYFFMGDNRDNAADSRVSLHGYVSRSSLIGKLIEIIPNNAE